MAGLIMRSKPFHGRAAAQNILHALLCEAAHKGQLAAPSQT